MRKWRYVVAVLAEENVTVKQGEQLALNQFDLLLIWQVIGVSVCDCPLLKKFIY